MAPGKRRSWRANPRRQTPIKGGRPKLSSCVLASIRDAVEREALRHGCALSYIVAVRLAASYGIERDRSNYDRNRR